MRIASLLLFLAFSALEALGVAQPRELPPGDRHPRTRAEWQAEEEEFYRGGRVWTKEYYPEYAELFDAFGAWHERVWRDFIQNPEVYSANLAQELVDQLYIDHQHPRFNTNGQRWVVDVIDQVLRWPEERLPAAARQALLTGLTEYICAGGGQDEPFMQAETAAVLWSVGSDDPTAQTIAHELMEDAVCWVYEVEGDEGLSLIADDAGRLWGALARLRMYDLTLPRAALPRHPPPRYLAAVEALNTLLQQEAADEGVFVKRVRRATELTLALHSDRYLQNDLICRLLIAYRVLLDRRPQISEKACEYIQRQLAHLARDGQLRTPRHWELWVEAVDAVGPGRLLDGLRGTIEGLHHWRAVSPAVRKRLEELLSVLGVEADPRPVKPRP